MQVGQGRIHIGGVFPELAFVADAVPKRTETGIGALMPWADRLWIVTYVAHTRTTGGGTGLFSLDGDLRLVKHPESVVGTYANRMIHSATHQLVIGPHVIDAEGKVRTADALVDHRLTATMEHLFEPERKVYVLTMEGLLFELDVVSLESELLMDVKPELGMRPEAVPHFKGGHTAQGRVVVSNNSYDEGDFEGHHADGRLGEWDGRSWQTLSTSPHTEVTGRKDMGEVLFALGWDNASALFQVLHNDQWTTYRLPKGTHTQDHAWTTEWPRIREIESERFMMNCSGMFYELPAFAYTGRMWGVRPVCTHLRIVGDYTSWRGLLVMAGDQTTPINDNNVYVGQPQSGLWFGKSDDLWSWGKPAGWGGPWWESEVRADEPSDPFPMTGFEHKVLHLAHDAGRDVDFVVQVDFMGTGRWHDYGTFTIGPSGYGHHVFPTGFSAHWVRVVPGSDCRATAQFTYT